MTIPHRRLCLCLRMPMFCLLCFPQVSGTLLTAELALQHGLACNTAGGTHHAHRAEGRRDALRTQPHRRPR